MPGTRSLLRAREDRDGRVLRPSSRAHAPRLPRRHPHVVRDERRPGVRAASVVNVLSWTARSKSEQTGGPTFCFSSVQWPRDAAVRFVIGRHRKSHVVSLPRHDTQAKPRAPYTRYTVHAMRVACAASPLARASTTGRVPWRVRDVATRVGPDDDSIRTGREDPIAVASRRTALFSLLGCGGAAGSGALGAGPRSRRLPPPPRWATAPNAWAC